MPCVRCSRCEARRTLPRHPDEYVRLPPCRACGKAAGYRVDRWRMAHEVGQGAPKPCQCGAYSFPHRKGHGWCDYNARLTAEDMQTRWEEGSYA